MPMNRLQFSLHALEAAGLLEWKGRHGLGCVCRTCQLAWDQREHDHNRGHAAYLDVLLYKASEASPR